jgi:hypothetical protein
MKRILVALAIFAGLGTLATPAMARGCHYRGCGYVRYYHHVRWYRSCIPCAPVYAPCTPVIPCQ